MRERPHVGRRLWRRRKRKSSSDPQAPSDVKPGHEEEADGDEEEEADEEADAIATPPAPPPAASSKPGFFARLFGKKPPAPPPIDAFVVDPVRDILAIPRGAARLDAFEKKLAELPPTDPAHKKVALGFHRELTALAEGAGVDLNLYEARVTACAKALIAAGEDEKAGLLYAKIGRRHQAAELFVKAGAIEALEEAHAELAFEEGGRKLDARLEFERFEALFLVGMRDDALAALEQAVKWWDNPVYLEVLAAFRARVPIAKRVMLQSGDDVVRVFGRFPLILGRGEESAVRIESPLVSRGHVQLDRIGLDVVVKDLVSSGGTRVDGHVISAPTKLPEAGAFDLAGVVIDVSRSSKRLLLRPRLRPSQVTIAPFEPVLDDEALGFRLTLRDERVRVDVDARVRLNNDVVRRETLLLSGDRLTVGGRTWTVSAA